MTNGKVLALYMTMPDMLIRSGHRMSCEDIDIDEAGIIGDIGYDSSEDKVIMLTSKKSYDIIDEADLFIDKGVLMESIHVDIDLYALGKGSLIEIGNVILEVTGPCESYGYLAALSPELPELLKGNRGIFVRPTEDGRLTLGDKVKVLKEVL
jgi:MOSC domain-containing protein YiiM